LVVWRGSREGWRPVELSNCLANVHIIHRQSENFERMVWKSALAGGVIGFLLGLFFKSLILVLITLNVPSLEKYLVDTFVPAHGISNPDFIRFFTVPLPFALLGAAIGALKYGGRGGATTPAVPET